MHIGASTCRFWSCSKLCSRWSKIITHISKKAASMKWKRTKNYYIHWSRTMEVFF